MKHILPGQWTSIERTEDVQIWFQYHTFFWSYSTFYFHEIWVKIWKVKKDGVKTQNSRSVICEQLLTERKNITKIRSGVISKTPSWQVGTFLTQKLSPKDVMQKCSQRSFKVYLKATVQRGCQNRRWHKLSSFKFCKGFWNGFFLEHLWTVASPLHRWNGTKSYVCSYS